MLDRLSPWPGQDKIPGRRELGGNEPHEPDPMNRSEVRAGWGHPTSHRPERADQRAMAPLMRVYALACSRCGSEEWGARNGRVICFSCGVRIEMLTDGSGPVVRDERAEPELPPLPDPKSIGDTILDVEDVDPPSGGTSE